MQAIKPLWEQMPLQPIQEPKYVRKTSGTVPIFGDIFQSAINNVKETDAEKTQLEYLMATGQLDNPALLTIASTKADYAVQLLVQLRNKALDAYNELTRINL